jgi:predicted DNA-binding transcriptional regulator
LHTTGREAITMISVSSDAAAGVIEITVDGAIDRADYEKVVTAVDLLLETHKQIDVIEIVRDLGWLPPQVWWRDIVFHLTHRNFLRRAAIVSDRGWVGPIVRLFAPLYPSAMRFFPEAEIDAARAWVRGRDAAA